jgi:hypothetical protein
VGFPARSQTREQEFLQQEGALLNQSRGRLRAAFLGNVVYILSGKGRPLTRLGETLTKDREIAALGRTFHTLHVRDAQWLERHASDLRRELAQLEADKSLLRAYAGQFGVTVNI